MERDRDPQPRTQPAAGRSSERTDGEGDGDSYRYEHSGIRERGGGIPLWLIVVVIGLIGWSIYYTIRYWSAE